MNEPPSRLMKATRVKVRNTARQLQAQQKPDHTYHAAARLYTWLFRTSLQALAMLAVNGNVLKTLHACMSTATHAQHTAEPHTTEPSNIAAQNCHGLTLLQCRNLLVHHTYAGNAKTAKQQNRRTTKERAPAAAEKTAQTAALYTRAMLPRTHQGHKKGCNEQKLLVHRQNWSAAQKVLAQGCCCYAAAGAGCFKRLERTVAMQNSD